MTPRERLLCALRCQPVDRPPVWLMRQAGRYLPEYRQLRSRYGFVEMVRTPELATEVTLQPLRRFPGIDAAILFSDILVVPEALGQPYHFREEGGIGMEFALRSRAQAGALAWSGACERLDYVARALAGIRRQLGPDRALLGFCGSPWTLAAYMVEGGGAEGFPALQALLREEPALLEELLERLTATLVDYLKLQAQSGADAVQVFDSWASLCPPGQYERWSLRWMRQIADALHGRIPVILYARGASAHLEALAATGVAALSVDWTVTLPEAAARVPPTTALQGNLDPARLESAEPAAIEAEARSMTASLAGRPGYIANLGHGLTPRARIECVEAFVRAFATPAPRGA